MASNVPISELIDDDQTTQSIHSQGDNHQLPANVNPTNPPSTQAHDLSTDHLMQPSAQISTVNDESTQPKSPIRVRFLRRKDTATTATGDNPHGAVLSTSETVPNLSETTVERSSVTAAPKFQFKRGNQANVAVPTAASGMGGSQQETTSLPLVSNQPRQTRMQTRNQAQKPPAVVVPRGSKASFTIETESDESDRDSRIAPAFNLSVNTTQIKSKQQQQQQKNKKSPYQDDDDDDDDDEQRYLSRITVQANRSAAPQTKIPPTSLRQTAINQQEYRRRIKQQVDIAVTKVMNEWDLLFPPLSLQQQQKQQQQPSQQSPPPRLPIRRKHCSKYELSDSEDDPYVSYNGEVLYTAKYAPKRTQQELAEFQAQTFAADIQVERELAEAEKELVAHQSKIESRLLQPDKVSQLVKAVMSINNHGGEVPLLPGESVSIDNEALVNKKNSKEDQNTGIVSQGDDDDDDDDDFDDTSDESFSSSSGSESSSESDDQDEQSSNQDDN